MMLIFLLRVSGDVIMVHSILSLRKVSTKKGGSVWILMKLFKDGARTVGSQYQGRFSTKTKAEARMVLLEREMGE